MAQQCMISVMILKRLTARLRKMVKIIQKMRRIKVLFTRYCDKKCVVVVKIGAVNLLVCVVKDDRGNKDTFWEEN